MHAATADNFYGYRYNASKTSNTNATQKQTGMTKLATTLASR